MSIVSEMTREEKVDAYYKVFTPLRKKAQEQEVDHEGSCLTCARFDEKWFHCKAFDDFPPAEIYAGLVKHDTPIPGDNGLLFLPEKPEAEMTDEEYEQACDRAEERMQRLGIERKNSCYWCGHSGSAMYANEASNEHPFACAKFKPRIPIDIMVGRIPCRYATYPRNMGLERL